MTKKELYRCNECKKLFVDKTECPLCGTKNIKGIRAGKKIKKMK